MKRRGKKKRVDKAGVTFRFFFVLCSRVAPERGLFCTRLRYCPPLRFSGRYGAYRGLWGDSEEVQTTRLTPAILMASAQASHGRASIGSPVLLCPRKTYRVAPWQSPAESRAATSAWRDHCEDDSRDEPILLYPTPRTRPPLTTHAPTLVRIGLRLAAARATCIMGYTSSYGNAQPDIVGWANPVVTNHRLPVTPSSYYTSTEISTVGKPCLSKDFHVGRSQILAEPKASGFIIAFSGYRPPALPFFWWFST